MNVNSILNTTANKTDSNSSSSPTQTKSSEDQKNMFMTLLVAQLKNQDPLQPQDNTAFVAQLAQFNSLDQLIGIRESMDQLVNALQTTTN
ncbi:MAG TPA: flagellar hook capping FlgD N-terminal domain-containing protein [Pyrinomonadaceae bacterium]|nr:flagellar hook capping FlgD N-terminal domain-containing protein [Pyrinomonadaceae bacterium]